MQDKVLGRPRTDLVGDDGTSLDLEAVTEY